MMKYSGNKGSFPVIFTVLSFVSLSLTVGGCGRGPAVTAEGPPAVVSEPLVRVVQGPAGKDGSNGKDGERGAQGLRGEQGLQGPQGERGGTGPAGPVGPQGGVGPAGPVGPQGGIGPVGPAGPVGPQGGVGPVGPAGPQGGVGPVGPAGPQGGVGPVGPQGPPPQVNYDRLRPQDGRDARVRVVHDCQFTQFRSPLFQAEPIPAGAIQSYLRAHGGQTGSNPALPYQTGNPNSTHLDILTLGGMNAPRTGTQNRVENAMVVFDIHMTNLPPRERINLEQLASAQFTLSLNIEKATPARDNAQSRRNDVIENLCLAGPNICSGNPLGGSFAGLNSNAYEWPNTRFGTRIPTTLGSRNGVIRFGTFTESLGRLFGQQNSATGEITPMEPGQVLDLIYRDQRLRFVVSDDVRVVSGSLHLSFIYNSCGAAGTSQNPRLEITYPEGSAATGTAPAPTR